MNSGGILLAMGLVLFLGVILNRSTSGAPVLDELDSSSVIKEFGGLAEFFSQRRKPPRQMPLSKNMTREQRIEWNKNCELYGTPCELAEQCCTRICLVATRECGAPAVPIKPWL